MSVKVTVRNKDKLFGKLRQLAPAASDGLVNASGQTAREMTALAKSYAPKHTGELADSIVATPPGGTPPAYGQGLRKVPEGAWMVTAGNSRVRYPHFAEFGVKGGYTVGGQFAGATHPGSPAQPFFWPAYRMIRRTFRKLVRKALKDSIAKVARK